ncbi:hypothetical protein HMPREF3213_01220 [Heyndrickxia coagulans]|uniref:Uncharacterized protein n=1 Tax=Heyndrickxia coagulans TaxID=1398 RepID=A0A133KV03_HEYCO|nr:hypothetical protein HMPREF3213_01220 [Heyndrickxia coagulans]
MYTFLCYSSTKNSDKEKKTHSFDRMMQKIDIGRKKWLNGSKTR